MSGAAVGVGVGLQALGAGLASYGQNINTQKAAAKKRELANYIQRVKGFMDPMEEATLWGWAPVGYSESPIFKDIRQDGSGWGYGLDPGVSRVLDNEPRLGKRGGFLRELASAAGQTAATAREAQALGKASTAGTLTATGWTPGGSSNLGYADAALESDILGTRKLAALGLGRMGRSMPRYQPLANPFAGVGGAMSGAGAALMNYGLTAKDTPYRQIGDDPEANYGPTPSGGNISDGQRVTY